MKKILLSIVTLFASFIMFAHKPNMWTEDLKNGTFKFIAKYSDDYPIEGASVYLMKDKPYNGPEDSYDGKLILLSRELNEKGEVIFYKPATKKWYVAFDQEAGHQFDFYEIPILTEEEKAEWEKLIKEDTNLTDKERENLLGK